MLSKEEVLKSLRTFKDRRDNLLHEDVDTFEHHLQRFIEFCNTDRLVKSILDPLRDKHKVDIKTWWEQRSQYQSKLAFPSDSEEEFVFRYLLLERVENDERLLITFGISLDKDKRDEWIELFRSLIVRPFVEELKNHLSSAANLATPEARDLQAVPFSRIPGQREVRIFLSHKSVDKPIVRRYHKALKQLGFDPWLDEDVMAAGTNLERGILEGFDESCAAVFFITKNFKDEKYLGSEVDYAIMQKRKKEKKFAIITLRYPEAADVPGLLRPYIFMDVENDLEGFFEVVRALPIELGPVRWKKDVIG